MKIRDQILNLDFCQALVKSLTDPFIQIRYNASCAISNLILCFSEHDIDMRFLSNCGLLNQITNIFQDYISTYSELKIADSEISKINKLIKSLYDLLILLIDLYDESKGYSKLNFDLLIGFSINFIICSSTNPEKQLYINEETILTISQFLCSFFSVHIMEINENNQLLSFINFALPIALSDNKEKANVVISSSFTCSLFYILIVNYEKSNEGEKAQLLSNIQKIIEKIYFNINFDICEEINHLNLNIQNFIKNVNKDDDNGKMEIECNLNSKSENKEDKNITNDLKVKIKHTEERARSNILYLKTFADLINSLDYLEPCNENTGEMIGDEEEEMEIEESVSLENIYDEKTEIEKRIFQTLSHLFTNIEPVSKMLNQTFLSNLLKYIGNLTIEEFLLHDFDKMVVLKEMLYDLEYYSISLINNLIRQFNGVFSNN
jgi:hypothetical protein